MRGLVCRMLLIAHLVILGACGGSESSGGNSPGSSSSSSSSAPTFSISGSVSGLLGTLVLSVNGGSPINITSNGPTTIRTGLNDGTVYTVAIATQPSGQACVLANAGGTIAGVNVTNLAVTCTMAAPVLALTPHRIKTFHFTWNDVSGESEYRLLEDINGTSGYNKVATLTANSQSYDLIVSLPKRINARYILQACNSNGCVDSSPINVAGNLGAAVGYAKPSNPMNLASFGNTVVLSADASTMAVGALLESNNITGVNGSPQSGDGMYSGAVYVFVRNGSSWSQQAYIKASNTGASDQFGYSLALSSDGTTLAVGAWREDSNATSIDGNQNDNSAADSGAVYVFTRSGTDWSQQAYVKASNTDAYDWFGSTVALSGDGNTLAVGAYGESSNATGINGNPGNNLAATSGAAYVFTRSGSSWTQQAYIKASNADPDDRFGKSVALSADGSTLAVGAYGEAGNVTGINGFQGDNSAHGTGAAYVFIRNAGTWSQQAYVKAGSPGSVGANFGWTVTLSGDGSTLAVSADTLNNGAAYIFGRSGNTWIQTGLFRSPVFGSLYHFGDAIALSFDGENLAVGADGEQSNAIGINGDQNNTGTFMSGAAYLFSRNGNNWSQQAYIKASNTQTGDYFGSSVALSSDGSIMAVGAKGEASKAFGMNGDQSDNSFSGSGAVYLY